MRIKLFFLPFLMLMGYFSLAQNSTKVIKSLQFDNETATEIIQRLVSDYGLDIDYSEVNFPKTRHKLWLDNVSHEDVLNQLVKVTGLDLVVEKKADNTFRIIPKEIITNKLSSEFQPSRTNFTLTGIIKDEDTGETLPFASILVLGHTGISAQTNVDGYFSLFQVPNDTISILVSYVGYRSKSFRLTPKTPLENLTVDLKNDASSLDEVVVTALKTEMVQANKTVGMIKMTPRNVAKLPNVGEKDPFRAFQLMPGVSASNESSSGLYVRGGTPDQTLVTYDGFTVYNVDHLFGFFSAFNYNAIKDIQLYKGAFDARFGGRISAVAEITGKEGNSKEFNAGVDLSLLSTNAFVETPIGEKLTFLAAVRRSYKGPLYSKIFDKFTADAETNTNTQQGPGGFGGGRGGNAQTVEEKASSYFYDLNAKLTYRPSTKDILSLSFFNGTDNMDNSSTSSFSGFGRFQNAGIDLGTATNDLSQWGNAGGSLKWSRKWNSKFYGNTLVSFSNFYSERDNSRTISVNRDGEAVDNRLGRVENNNLSDFSLKTDWEYKIDKNNQLEFGGMITQNNIKFNYIQNDTTTILDRDDTGMISSVYLQDRLSAFNGKLELIPGLRANHFDVTNKVYLEPRLTFNYLLTDKLKLKGGTGIYNQFIKQINREDISQGNRNFWILANGSNLPVTQSKHIVIGAAYETKDYLLDVELYQKNNTGITEYSLRFVPDFAGGGAPGPGGQRGGGIAIDETFFNGDETIRGIDVLLQKKFGKITGWLGYTYSEAVREISAFSDKPYYSDQDVRHQFKAVGTYSVNNWDLAATWIYATGRPYTSIIGAYNLTLLDGTTKSFTNPSDKNANRFPEYHRMDVSATYNFKHGSLGLSVFNLYNRTNVWYKRFEVIEENDVSALQTTDVVYLGFTPNLTLTLRLK
ncbi:Outer membrane receptor for ferrienterochelin and colicins [Spirosomataceae bacterium TFI 002]|nr:Outer membrane receptor for ferrienterochelin and colicins [Spirosomataceae bacterium TFI 002]